jgi:predicted dehydrogenase
MRPTAGEDLVADPEVEAVVLAFPARGRAEMALRAFASAKHVLTEKLVAINADEVIRMIAAQGDLVVGCCSSRYRFLKSAAAATDFLASGVLGELRVVRGSAVVPASGPPENTSFGSVVGRPSASKCQPSGISWSFVAATQILPCETTDVAKSKKMA